MNNSEQSTPVDAVAIIGMAGRFPGAKSVEEYWLNLCNGVESISSFTPEDLRAAGKDPSVVTNPDYVPRRGILDGVELFDAEFFGLSPREAEVTDPQQRVFLECAWQALELAGYDPDRFRGSIGVYAGTSLSEYLFYLYSNPELIRRAGSFQTVHGNDKDFLATRTSYKLNLRGPSVNINTACSTSLVAVAIACQSLLNGECDMALAGGVTISFPQITGYFFQEGSIMSPDGHCRAFDARAQGTVGGNGVGIVVLKRLEDAVADGDHVIAVIKGFATNNDGAMKVGFTAPSVEGQTAVIRAAMAHAGVKPDSITYVEAHGTGTSLGDPIELAALTRAFRAGTDKKQFCAIGSVKTNVGHLDVAAGIAGLIKTALAVKHGIIPPSLHYERPNPAIDFDASPFYVNARLQRWKPETGLRRAGVSSFGIGGTNAHVVLEEGPPAGIPSESRQTQLVVLSARTDDSLYQAAVNLRQYLQMANGEDGLPDVAYTLAVGRKGFKHRRAVVFSHRKEAVQKLGEETAADSLQGQWKGNHLPLAVLLSGQGSQYVQMGRELYERERIFRQEVDRASEYLKPLMGLDLRQVMYAKPKGEAEAAKLLNQTWVTQPALYVLECALMKQWESWGVKPGAMLGHSLGELVAARGAGVFSEDDGLRLAAARGRLMWETEPGAMLSVVMSEGEARRYETNRISLAAVNGRQQVVFSGGLEEIEDLEEKLTKQDVVSRRLEVERAFHSEKMDCIRNEFLNLVKGLTLCKPSKRYISNVTGKWAGEEVTEPGYWWQQMRSPVRFAASMQHMLVESEWVWLEAGPAEVLSKLVRSELRARGAQQVVVTSLGGRGKRGKEQEQMMQALAELWVKGVEVDWTGYYRDERRCRVVLPTYPFQRQRYLATLPDAQLLQGGGDNHPAELSPEKSNIKVISAATRAMNTEKETAMSTATQTISTKYARREMLIQKLCQAWGNLLGVAAAEIDPAATFFALGVDSLLLIQISKLIKDEFKLRIPFRRLLEEFTTIGSLAEYLDQTLPQDQFQPAGQVAEGPPVILTAELPFAVARPQLVPVQPMALPVGNVAGNGVADMASSSIIDAVVTQQLQLMSQQLEILRTAHTNEIHAVLPQVDRHPALAQVAAVSVAPTPSMLGKPVVAPVKLKNTTPRTEPFVPYAPIRPNAGDALTLRQKNHLDAFIASYNKRTIKSKEHTGKYRPFLADNRAMQGFRLQWKELVYPIVSQRSQGAHFWDLDGNQYVDMTMGFGVHLFGHSPSFVVEAIEKQLRSGIQLGPQSYLAGQVAQSISEMTGMQRVTFCNSGTEAVMAALRLARLVTGRDRVVMFAGSYHGTFDGNLARIQKDADGALRTVPVGLGTTQNTVKDMNVLYYNDPESLDFIKRHGHELAAVLVEPVQSRRPEIQPREFLQELRRLTEQSGTALIFDDMVTGFRIHLGGTQAWFDVKADIATYGKVAAGGMPIGIIAGRDEYLGGIDGGLWDYGDTSYPQSDQVIFAGTFCKHPLTMAACDAVLTHLRQSGPELQLNLNARATRFIDSLNHILVDNNVPMRMANFGSLMRFLLLGNPSYMDLFFYHLIAKGVFVWEGRTAYLSTAHTDEDLQFVIRAFEETIVEMREGGFLPEVAIAAEAMTPAAAALPVQVAEGTNGGAGEVRIVPASEQQKQIWALAQMGEESSCAYNQSIALTLHGRVQEDFLRRALRKVVDRHEALRTVFSSDGEYQRILPALDVPISLLDLFGDPEREIKKLDALKSAARAPFDLINGPLLRVLLIKLAEDLWVLAVSTHHSVVDGWSGGTVLKDLNAFYLADSRGEKLDLPNPMQFAHYVDWPTTQDELADMDESRAYWLKCFADSVPLLELPTNQPRSPFYSFAGSEQRLSLGPALSDKLRALCGQHGFTLFAGLLSAYAVLLSHASGQQQFVLGIHSAGQTLVDGSDLVGHCINLVPLRACAKPEATFLQHVSDCKTTILDACAHQLYPYSKLAKDLNLRRDPRRLTLVEAVFNLDQISTGIRIFGLDPEVNTTPSGYSKWDLSFDVADAGNDIHVKCEYNRDLYSAERVHQWLEDYEAILSIIAEWPEIKLSGILKQVETRLLQKREKGMKILKAANLEKLKNAKRKSYVTSPVEYLHQG